MRWPWNRREPAGAPEQASGSVPEAPTLDRPMAAWASLPAISPTFAAPVLTTAPVDFAAGLASRRSGAVMATTLQRQVDPVISRVGPDPSGWGVGGPTARPDAAATPVAARRASQVRSGAPGRSTGSWGTFTTTAYAALSASGPSRSSVLTSAPQEGLPVVQLTAEPLPPELTPPQDVEPLGAELSGSEQATPDATPAPPVSAPLPEPSPQVGAPTLPARASSAEGPAAVQRSASADVPVATPPPAPTTATWAEPGPPRPLPVRHPRQERSETPTASVQRAPLPVGHASQPSQPATDHPATASRSQSAVAGAQASATGSSPVPVPLADDPEQVQRLTPDEVPAPHEDEVVQAGWPAESSAWAVAPDPTVASDGTDDVTLAGTATRPDPPPSAVPTRMPVQRSADVVEPALDPDPSGTDPSRTDLSGPMSSGAGTATSAQDPTAPDVRVAFPDASETRSEAGSRPAVPSRLRLGLGEPLPSVPVSGGSEPAFPRPAATPASGPVVSRVSALPGTAQRLPLVQRAMTDPGSEDRPSAGSPGPAPLVVHEVAADGDGDGATTVAIPWVGDSPVSLTTANSLGGQRSESSAAVQRFQTPAGVEHAAAPAAGPSALAADPSEPRTTHTLAAERGPEGGPHLELSDVVRPPAAPTGPLALPVQRHEATPDDAPPAASDEEPPSATAGSWEPSMGAPPDAPPSLPPAAPLSVEPAAPLPLEQAGQLPVPPAVPLRVQRSVPPLTQARVLPLQRWPEQLPGNGSSGARTPAIATIELPPSRRGGPTVTPLATVQTLRIGSHRAPPWTPATQPQPPGPAPQIGMPLGRPSAAAYPAPDGLDATGAPATTEAGDATQPDPADVAVAARPGPSAAQASDEEVASAGGDAQSNPAASAAGAAPAESATQVDELARKLFDPLMLRLRAELLVERERRGLRTDAW